MSDIWECKIGETDVSREEWTPNGGADLPMRNAVEKAYYEVTGEYANFCFSGWGSSLNSGQRAAVEDRVPTQEEIKRDIQWHKYQIEILEGGLHE